MTMRFYSKDTRKFEKRKLVVKFLEMPFKDEKITMFKGNIDRFIRPEWHRDFKDAHVSSIAGGILAGVHPSESITVNFNSQTRDYRVINGNHRIAAIKKVIDNHPEFKIEMGVKCYKDLSLDEERDLYTLIGTHKPESINDFLKSHCSDSLIFKLIQKDFPCKVWFYSRSGTPNYLKFDMLVKPYIQRNITSKIIISYNRRILVNQIKQLDQTDYERMRDFVLFFKENFGDPSSDNVYSDPNRLLVLARIYYSENIGTVTKRNLSKRFQYLVKSKPALFNKRITSIDIDDYYNELVKEINKVRRFDRGVVVNILDATKTVQDEKKELNLSDDTLGVEGDDEEEKELEFDE